MAEIAASPRADASIIDWSAAVWSGVIAGAVFMVLEMMTDQE